MEEQNQTGIKPVFNKEEGWKAAQEQKKKLIAKSNHSEKDAVEEPSRRPAPLPFGKIDILV
ncbi:hypothetical protein KKA00_08335 [bacterium]|nr:hypothetical protein [bacterium]MBU1652214.1 hypothetical protein [bacterium]